MDKLAKYRSILQRILGELAEHPPSDTNVESFPIFDTVKDHFLLVDIGWDRNGRAHDIIVHFRILNGKIWVEWDGTNLELVQQLLDAGVPKEDIVLAFYRPERRAITEFAVA
jgi:hypothetical protein